MTRTAWWLAPLLLCMACDGGGGDGGGGPADDELDGSTADVPRVGGKKPAPVAEYRPQARFALADDLATTPFGQVPFPNDIYRKPDGLLDLRGFPIPRRGVLTLMLDALQAETRGFGTSASLYLSFEDDIDQSVLPKDGGESLDEQSALFLVDIDPASRQRGTRWPIRWRYRETATQYLPEFSLSVRLVEGVALQPATTYALVVTERVALPSETFAAVIGDGEPDGAAGKVWALYAPLREWLTESGVKAAAASVFTTQDPVEELFRIRDFMHEELPVPALIDVTSRGVHQQRFELFAGTYRAPRFQQGEIPYKRAGEGAIRFDDRGRPKIAEDELIHFALSVPKDGEMPPDGWPIVLYAHGTGGSRLSFANPGELIAARLAREGMAVISIDQVHHGERNPRCKTSADRFTCVALDFFNFLTPTAGRDNVRQAALDLVSLLRFVQNDFKLGADQSNIGRAVKLDPRRVGYMGHSQGGLNGPLFLAVEPKMPGGVLSGAGSTIAISIEQKEEPFSLKQPIQAALGLPASDPLDRWHPSLMLLQTFIEPGDPVNYARYWFAEPPAGSAPKHVFMTAGLEDPYTPPDAIFALAAAGRVPIIEPVQKEIEAHELLRIPTAGIPPYKGNVAEGKASAGLAQYPGEGHFVIFDSQSAQQRYARFLSDLTLRNPPQIY